MYNAVFFIITGILIFSFLLDKILDYLNLKNTVNVLPAEVQDVYDPERYKESQNYKKVNTRFSFLTSSFNLGLIFIMLFIGGFGIVNNLVFSLTGNSIIAALMFFGIIGFASDIINTPFELYGTFVIEEKFGFNKTTPRIFILDKIKPPRGPRSVL